MKPLPLAQSVRLPEAQAVQRHLDDLSWRTFRWLLAAFLIGSPVGFGLSLEDGRWAPAVGWGVGFIVIVVLVVCRKRRWFERYFRELLIGYLVMLAVVLILTSTATEFNYALGGYIAPFVLLFFRFRRVELLSLLLAGLGVAVWFALYPDHATTVDWGTKTAMVIGATAGCFMSFVVGNRITAGRIRAFLSEWRVEHGRAREQARMREELADAREIQLSMLPHRAPTLPWLDLASASLPATEVGGDYFDYVSLDHDRLAIVVGDVAGHGMASGLVLASIRGGLHLLRGELADPLQALRRLDRMVREIAPGRMYVTLQIAVLDHRERKVTVVSAGHPPVLHFQRSEDRVGEIGGPAIPLGTGLESTLTEHSRPLEAGDVLLFYSDGVPEATDVHSEMFGDSRLAAALQRSATGLSAAEVRTSILDSVNRFKGDVELADDLTVVVAKVSG